MTAANDLDRRLSAWFDASSTSREPDHLLETSLARVAVTRQRPRWLASERWLDMSTLTLPWRPVIRTAWLLVVLGLLLGLALAALYLSAGRTGFPANGGIVYARDGDLYLVAPGGDRDLTSGGGKEQGVSFAPDGARMAFWSQAPDGVWSLDIAAPDGSGLKVVAPTFRFDPTYAGEPIDWASDGHRVAVASKVDGISRVLVVDVATGDVRDIAGRTLAAAEEAAWSHDARSIAFRGALDASGTAHALFVVDVASGVARRVSGPLDTGLDAVGYGRPAWSPDDRTIVFDAADTSGATTAFALYSVSPDGSGQRRLTAQGRNGYAPRFSPDGRSIAFTDWQDPVSSLWVMAADGSGQRLLRERVVSDSITWSPDGMLIVFEVQPTSGDDSLYSIRHDGTDLTLLSASTASQPRAGLSWQARP
jgi:dipeptidyl aminopeptidase/acylaminoacyl peptidase